MITLFEKYKEQPKIGDYVVCKENNTSDIMVPRAILISQFVNCNIGKLIKILSYRTTEYVYVIQYKNIPEYIKSYFGMVVRDVYNCRTYKKEEMLAFSNDKKDLEMYLQANKYNL